MPTNRLEAFSDGVLAVIITIMVLELKPPAGGSFSALGGIAGGLRGPTAPSSRGHRSRPTGSTC